MASHAFLPLYRSAMDLAGFDLNLLKAFDALYAERHVTHAGQRIGINQSAMSARLARSGLRGRCWASRRH